MDTAHHQPHDAHDIKKEVRTYLMVFGVLLFLTIVTVAVSYLHLEIHEAIMIALFVAVIKSGLVACFFMHLISERKLIYIVLGITIIFFISVMTIPMSEMHHSKIKDTTFVP